MHAAEEPCRMPDDAIPADGPETGAAAPADPAAARAGRRGRAALDALRALLRETYAGRFGSAASVAAEIPLALRLVARPRDDWALEFAVPFEEQVTESLDAAQAVAGAFEAGRVFCHRCGAACCPHAAPADPWQVFRGYDATGRPVWGEFAQVVIDARDARAAQLYATPPSILACVQSGHELRKAQLAAFGRASRNYAVLGQVVAGYFPNGVRSAASHGVAPRLALTIQIVEARDGANRLALRLNAIVGGATAADWDELLASRWCPWVSRAVRQATQAVAAAQRELATGRETGRPPGETYRRIPGLLRRLAQSLEQGARQDAGRTQHAAHRRTERRPVHKALADLADARVAQGYWDVRHNTWIVCGQQGRAHAFGRDGRLVTSLAISAGSAEFRVRTGRWRPLETAEFAQFRAAVAAVGATTRKGRGEAP